MLGKHKQYSQPVNEEQALLNRWRLVLGKYSQDQLGEYGSGEEAFQQMDRLLDFIYGREYGKERDIMEGSQSESVFSIPSWIDQIHSLFPKETVEKLESDALERYQIRDLLTDARVLERLEPNMTLLKQILSLKRLMKGEVLETARRVVRQVAGELRRKLEQEMVQAIVGRRDRTQSTTLKIARNFDFKKTVRKNLKNFDRERNQILIDKVYYNKNVKRHNPWHIILCVDESGSMMDNVIHAAVMAGIFARLPALSTRLVIFDTNVVDLSGYVDDPVETLMSIQLGGGTDIGKALAYCETLVTNPHRTILVLISDLCDGAGYRPMYAHASSLVESGARLMCLTSLNSGSEGMYDRTAAKKLAALGASVAALTPARLADWIGSVIGEGNV